MLLATFEIKILRKIYGVQVDNEWRHRYNFELYNSYKRSGNTDIVTIIKTGRLTWAGHVVHYDKGVATR